MCIRDRGDTGPAVALGEFAAGTDVFVCECSLPDELVGDNHLGPTAVARFAAAADPGLLLVTHVYPQLRASTDVGARIRAAGYGGRLALAEEGWSTTLPPPDR